MTMFYLEIGYKAVTQGSQQLEQQVNVGWVVAEVVQQNFHDQLRLFPVGAINVLHFLVDVLKKKCRLLKLTL